MFRILGFVNPGFEKQWNQRFLVFRHLACRSKASSPPDQRSAFGVCPILGVPGCGYQDSSYSL